MASTVTMSHLRFALATKLYNNFFGFEVKANDVHKMPDFHRSLLLLLPIIKAGLRLISIIALDKCHVIEMFLIFPLFPSICLLLQKVSS